MSKFHCRLILAYFTFQFCNLASALTECNELIAHAVRQERLTQSRTANRIIPRSKAPLHDELVAEITDKELQAHSNAKNSKLFLDLAQRNLALGMIQEAAWNFAKAGSSELASSALTKLRSILETGSIRGVQSLGGGISRSYLFDLGDGVFGVFKPADTVIFAANHHLEVAAYEVDQAFNIGVVPMTVLRTYQGEIGSLQYFIRSGVDSGDRSILTHVLDYLILNEDRIGSNTVIRPGGQIVGIDHGMSFGVGYENSALELPATRKIPKHVADSLRDVTDDFLRVRIGGLLHEAYFHIKNSQKATDETMRQIVQDPDPDSLFRSFVERRNQLRAALMSQ